MEICPRAVGKVEVDVVHRARLYSRLMRGEMLKPPVLICREERPQLGPIQANTASMAPFLRAAPYLLAVVVAIYLVYLALQ